MLIRSLRAPSVVADVRGSTYFFENHLCEVPIQDALYLLRHGEFVPNEPFPKFNPDSWLKERKLLWNAPYSGPNTTVTGFALFSEQVMNALTKYADVYAMDTVHLEHVKPEAYSEISRQVFRKKLDRLDVFQIKVSLYHEFEPPQLDYTIGYTMFETTRIPQARVMTLNQERRVWVPCPQNVDSFKDSGVTRPIDVMPLGFTPEYYPYIDRPVKKKDEPFVFGTFGKLTRRKGVFEAIEAFRQEFHHDEDVRFVIHTNQAFVPWWDFQDERIETNIVRFPTQEMTDKLLRHFDVAVFPTKGEGWGLPALESAATGLPTIVTNFSGPTGYVNDDFMKLDYELEPVFDYPEEWGYIGDWAKVDVDQLRKYMRWCYENREEAKAMGKRASEYVHNTFTYDHAAKRIVEKLDELAKEMQ